MKELIDKSVVIAEIEKLKAYLQIPNAQLEAIKVCDNVISVIDTLETKEVDLNREIEKEIETRWRGEYLFTTKFKESAKHFFELGLKAKGE